MEFEKKVPVWNAAGTEPPEELKNTGFTGGYKPPAEFFNWFMHGTSAALQEMQNSLASSYKIYTSLEQIGFPASSNSWNRMSIALLMPRNSILIIEVGAYKSAGEYPEQVPALLHATRYANGIVEFKWAPLPDGVYGSMGDVYFSFVYSSVNVSGWSRATTNFTDLKQIGITSTSDLYCFDIHEAMPVGGRLSYYVADENASSFLYPENQGFFEAYKVDDNFSVYKFFTKTNDQYVGTCRYNEEYSSISFSTWKKLAQDVGVPRTRVADAGKFLRVNSEGKYVLEAVPAAEGVGF